MKYIGKVASLAALTLVAGLLSAHPASANGVTTFSDTTSADFASGTVDANATVTTQGGGAVASNAVASTYTSALTGTSLPGDWTNTSWGSNSSLSVDSSGTTVEHGIVESSEPVQVGNTIEFDATLRAGVWQQFGLRNDDGSTYVDFATAGTGTSVNVQTPVSVVAIDDTWIGTEHHYRIDWSSTKASFFIDGSKVATLPLNVIDEMHPYFADAVDDSVALTVSAVTVSPDPVSSTYLSRIIDAHDPFAWGPLSWSATPDNESVTMDVRTGPSSSPDTDWTPFHPIARGTNAAATSRYIQYQAHLWTTVSGPVSLLDVTFTRATSMTDSTVFDYSQGAVTGGDVSDLDNGAVSASRDCDFSGTALCDGWTTTLDSSAGHVIVGDGRVAVSSALVQSPALAPAGRSMQFDATFSAGRWQHAGFLGSWADSTYAMFTTAGDGSMLYVQTPDALVDLSDEWLNSDHHYRIDWAATTVTFLIDGTEVASLPIAITGSMSPALHDYATSDGALSVDRVRVATLTSATTTTLNSRVLDTGDGAAVNWSNALWTADVPTGTTVTVGARTGYSATPDGTWSTYHALSQNQSTGLSGRFLQYQVVMTSTAGGAVPTFNDITFATTPLAMTSLTQTSGADFTAGTGTGTVVVTASGQVKPITPLTAAFTTSTPSGWTGSATYSSGNAHISSNSVQRTDSSYFKGATIDFYATLPSDHDTRVGWNSAFFRSQPGYNVLIYNDTTLQYYELPGAWLTDVQRHYRIEMDATTTRYYIDGNLVGTLAAVAGNVTPLFLDLGGSTSLLFHGVNISTTSSQPATFESKPMDAGQRVCWGALSWGGTLPTNTSVSFEVRTGDSPTPDGSWSAYTSVSPGVNIALNSRYIQYRATSTSSGANRPTINDVTLGRAYGGFC